MAQKAQPQGVRVFDPLCRLDGKEPQHSTRSCLAIPLRPGSNDNNQPESTTVLLLRSILHPTTRSDFGTSPRSAPKDRQQVILLLICHFDTIEGTTTNHPDSSTPCLSAWEEQPPSRTRVRQVTPLRQSRNCSSKLRSVKSECLEGPVVKYPGSGPPRYSARKEPLRPNRTLVCRVVRVDGSCNKPTGFCFVV